MNVTSAPVLDTQEDLRCSVQRAALGEAAAGSAGSALSYVLVELPLPWPKPIGAHPLLQGLPRDVAMMSPSARVLAIAGPATAPGATTHRIIVHRRNADDLAYRGTETVVSTADLLDAVAHAARSADPTSDLAPLPGEPVETHDVLICTQGTHDRCCGHFGMQLFQQLCQQPVTNVRAWRTSHTGGHRFAPTGVHFPSATMWAGLDHALVSNIADASVTAEQLGTHLRGAMGVDGKLEQLADAAAAAKHGWRWLADAGRHVRSTETDHTTGESRITIGTTNPDLPAQLVVLLAKADNAPVPVCGEPLDQAVKFSEQHRVVSVTES